MKIVYVVSECFPFFKTGGLADVAYAFPRELSKNQNNDVSVIMPFLEGIPKKYTDKMRTSLVFSISLNKTVYRVIVKNLKLDNVNYYFLESENANSYSNCYTNNVSPIDYAFFSKAVVEYLVLAEKIPNILHLNDWHTALISYIVKNDPRFQNKKMKVVYTIHNLQYQGIFDKSQILDLLEVMNHNDFVGFKDHCLINFMKIGIMHSDIVTTVSPTYMIEIQMQEFGMGLNNILRENSNKLYGVLNGIDYTVFNPKTDVLLDYSYDERDVLSKKAKNKAKLFEEIGQRAEDKKFLLSLITRLADQKGIDIFLQSIEKLLKNKDIFIFILGTGDAFYEHSFKELETRYPHALKACLKFDEKLARKLYASSDALLVPSYFEPCGLNQLIALKYGTVPIVREVGGLADTIKPYYQTKGTGFLFKEYSPDSLIETVSQAKRIFYDDKELWVRLIKNGMNQNFSWDEIVKQYVKLYLG